jgi:hypothetical protein
VPSRRSEGEAIHLARFGSAGSKTIGFLQSLLCSPNDRSAKAPIEATRK